MRKLSLLIFFLMSNLLFAEDSDAIIETNNIIETKVKLVQLKGDCREADFDKWIDLKVEKESAVLETENSKYVLKRVSGQNIFEATYGDLGQVIIAEKNDLSLFRYMRFEINLENNTFLYTNITSLNVNRPVWCEGKIEFQE